MRLTIAPLLCFPLAAQELLFRCALLPAVGADWAGVAVAAAVFGALHVGGGRNAAFAVWASVVGLAYGALAVTLRDGSAPMAAHALANAAGALAWRAAHPERVQAAQAAVAAGAAAAAADAGGKAAAGGAPASRAAPERTAWWADQSRDSDS